MVEVPPVTEEMRANALASVDAEMLDSLGRAEARLSARMVRQLPPMHLQVKPDLPMHLNPVDWGVRVIEIRELDMFGGQLREDLRVVTPQALLRDLHRPVRTTAWYQFVPMVDTLDHAGLRGVAEAKAAQNYERATPVPSMTLAVREEQERRRAWLANRWQPHYRDDEVHPAVEVVHL